MKTLRLRSRRHGPRAAVVEKSVRRFLMLGAIPLVIALAFGWALLGRSGNGGGSPLGHKGLSIGASHAGVAGAPASGREMPARDLGAMGPDAGHAPSAAQGAVASAPFDLGKVIEQVHYAFREEGSAWRGGHTTYEARLEGGALEVTPYHHPNGSPEAGRAEVNAPRHGSDPVVPRPTAPEEVVKGSAVCLAGTRVTRGPTSLASGQPEVTRNAQGQLELLHEGGIVEHLRNGPDGVEQSWELERTPDGEGDLEVLVPVAAGEYLGATESGLHFTGGELGVRYGHATWVDAAGMKTPIEARWEGEAIALRVPSELLDASAYPAVLDPVISPEFGMDAPVYGPAGGSQNAPAVAWGGTNYLVVWGDGRSGSDIYGARVSGAGVVQDSAGIPISTAARDQERPAVAWDGTNYLVVWQDYRSGPGYADIYGARVSAAGAVQDAAGIPITTATDEQYAPAVAWDGTNYLVVWEDYRSGTSLDIYAARVSAAGAVQDAAGIPVSTAVYDQYAPAVAWGGTNYQVVWNDYRSGTNLDIYGARVSAAGGVQDVAGIPISTAAYDESAPAVAWDGTNYFVVWQDSRSGTSNDIYGARVSAAGAVQDMTGIPISTAANHEYAPAVAWDGTNYFVVWQDSRSGTSNDIYGARVSAAGAVQDVSGIPISMAANEQYAPAVAWDGTNYLVVWTDYRSGSWDIYGARMSAAGVVQDVSGIPISMAANEQYAAAVAWDGTNYLVVWQDYRSGTGYDIYGARVSAAGAVQDAAGIPISTAANEQSAPALAWSGTSYLVVWQDYRSGGGSPLIDIYGARVTAAGAVQDAGGIPISTASDSQLAPAVAWGGTNYLVVWTDYRSGTNVDIYGARVSAAGVVQDGTGIPISAAPSAFAPAVAWDGTSYLVVWADVRSGTSNDIYGARVSAAGAVQDPGGIPISTAANHQYRPAVAWDGTNHLVVWEDWRSGGCDIYGARVSAAGAVQDPAGIPISTAANHQFAPAVAWDGTNHLVVWQDYRSGASWDIYAAQVSAAGAVQDPDGILVSASSYDETAPALASSALRRFLVTYDGFDVDPTVLSQRVLARTVKN